jgi:hypothetical protein
METVFTKVQQYLPLLLPLVILQLSMMIFSLSDLLRQSHTKGPKWVWALLVVFVQLFGPIVYFLFGRIEE